MDDQDIITEINKAAHLFKDDVYTVPDLVSHIMQIIRDEKQEIIDKAMIVKNALEKLLHLIEELRKCTREIKAGNKQMISRRSSLGKEIDLVIIKLHQAGYNTDRFKETIKTEQANLF